MSIVIEIAGLHKTYSAPKRSGSHTGRRTVLEGIDLQVETGEVLALLGPNGAGKTTLVEILEGYRRRDRGTVSVLGVDPVDGDAVWRSRIGIVSQQTPSSDEVTVLEALDLHATYFPKPRDVDEVLALVGLTEHRNMRVPRLSGGQARRLDVACGVIGRPELLFLDEPTTGFDPEARRQFWELIRQLSAEGTTILLTTHYLDEADALADRVAVLLGGRIQRIGTPAALRLDTNAEIVVSWREGASPHSVTTSTPTAVMRELLARFDGEIPHLAVTRPSLEDAYLALVEENAR
jgi:ABC-2 type transport system ATP-binding protein